MEKEKEKEKEKPKTTVSFYGKKVYYLNPMIARKKPSNEKMPDYRNEAAKQQNEN